MQDGAIFGRVIEDGRCYHPAGVSEQFPDDHLLALVQAESFLGLPLFGSSDRKLGLLAIMHASPLRNLEAVESVISVFAVRTAVELERRRAEEELNKRTVELETTN